MTEAVTPEQVDARIQGALDRSDADFPADTVAWYGGAYIVLRIGEPPKYAECRFPADADDDRLDFEIESTARRLKDSLA